jgi:hypothetical protein
VDVGIGYLPSGTVPATGWRVYSPFMPDDRDRAIAVANTSPVLDGSIAATGEVIEHPGIQVKVRDAAGNHDPGHEKGLAVQKALTESLRRATVVVGGKTFILFKFTLSAGLTFVGLEEQNNRPWWVINGTLTVAEVSP